MGYGPGLAIGDPARALDGKLRLRLPRRPEVQVVVEPLGRLSHHRPPQAVTMMPQPGRGSVVVCSGRPGRWCDALRLRYRACTRRFTLRDAAMAGWWSRRGLRRLLSGLV